MPYKIHKPRLSFFVFSRSTVPISRYSFFQVMTHDGFGMFEPDSGGKAIL